MDAARALADLTEISSQIEAAVLATREGDVLASTLGDDGKGKEVAGLARELITAAEEARGKEGEPLAQLQAATTQGSVFVVRDEGNLVAAVTTPKPTAGLVFYDLKTCLRLLEQEQAEPKPKPKPKPTRAPRKKKDEDGS